jgi:hypothetical protein
LKRYGILKFQGYFGGFFWARDSFGIIFQKPGSNCEIWDCGLILEKPRGFFAKLLGLLILELFL